jgi:hypothetical protein
MIMDERHCSSAHTSPIEKQRSLTRIDNTLLNANDERVIASIGMFLYALVARRVGTSQQVSHRQKTIPVSNDPFEVFTHKEAISSSVSSYKIFLFVLAMVAEAECTAECHITALVLVCRLIRVAGFRLTPTNWPVAFTCAFNIAQKMQDDASLSNWDFVDVFQEVNFHATAHTIAHAVAHAPIPPLRPSSLHPSFSPLTRLLPTPHPLTRLLPTLSI